MVVDDKSGGCHVAYTLARPVHRGVDARIRPLKYLARIEGWLSAIMGADGAFPGVLTHNPMAKAQMRGRLYDMGPRVPPIRSLSLAITYQRDGVGPPSTRGQ